MSSFNAKQIEQLLKPINSTRVLSDGKGFSHVSQQDILAHLTRIFGFGNFDIDVEQVELVFETEQTDPKTGALTNRFDVCYKALVRLTIRNEDGNYVCHFENGSMETARNQSRGDAHDLAYKSAISLSIKRAAIALGDQFGLSLYNKGQMSALVKNTLVGITSDTIPADVQEGVPQQVSLGNDEKDDQTPASTKLAKVVPIAKAVEVPEPVVIATADTEKPLAVAQFASGDLLRSVYQSIQEATTLEELRRIWTQNFEVLDIGFAMKSGDSSWLAILRTEIELRRVIIEGNPNE